MGGGVDPPLCFSVQPQGLNSPRDWVSAGLPGYAEPPPAPPPPPRPSPCQRHTSEDARPDGPTAPAERKEAEPPAAKTEADGDRRPGRDGSPGRGKGDRKEAGRDREKDRAQAARFAPDNWYPGGGCHGDLGIYFGCSPGKEDLKLSSGGWKCSTGAPTMSDICLRMPHIGIRSAVHRDSLPRGLAGITL